MSENTGPKRSSLDGSPLDEVSLYGSLAGPAIDSEAPAGLHLRRSEFSLASTNVDEDLHFSSFYIEGTTSLPERPPLANWYSEMVMIHEQGIERYYLRIDECRQVSEHLLAIMDEDPSWMPLLLNEIRRRLVHLEDVFPLNWLSSDPSVWSNDDLAILYRRHYVAHTLVYAVARIPEALDRCVSVFTDRLRAYLAGTDADESVAFAELAAPSEPSVFMRELNAFEMIVGGLTDAERIAVARSRHNGLTLMALAPASIERLEAHRAAWTPMYYHGFGSRDPIALVDLAGRLRRFVVEDFRTSVRSTPLDSGRERERLAESYGLSPAQVREFQLYGQLGLSKANRRWLQLRNFRRLDLLMSRISSRLDVSEWELRKLFPSELFAWLAHGVKPAEALAERSADCLVTASHGAVSVSQLASEVRVAFSPDVMLQGEVIGTPTVAGRKVGRCVKLGRAGALSDASLGGVLVASQIESDHIWMLPYFDAIVTEESGPTSHVAIIARELGITTVTGAVGVDTMLSVGDQVVVDGDAGVVRRV